MRVANATIGLRTGLQLFLMAIVMVGSAAADEGAALYEQTCAVCHGAAAEGNEAMSAPALAGQAGWYLETQLHNFKTGVRAYEATDSNGQIMRAALTEKIGDPEIASLASYLESLPAQFPKDAVEGNLRRGSGNFAVCGGCHGSKGQGNKNLQAPRLTILTDRYIKAQLANYRSGLRGAKLEDVAGQQMQPMAEMFVDDSSINDLLAHLATLRQTQVDQQAH
ncbi:MAG: c-type cytochrome [Halioglobus sp.]